jgi:hypothetical protein
MKTSWIWTFALVAILMTSCQKDDDSYSVGKFWVGFGIIDKSGPDSFTVQMDDGSIIHPVAGNLNGSWFEDDQRVLVNYTIVSDKKVDETDKEYFVKINSARKILMKGIVDITEAIEDSIGNDPVIIRDAWMSSNQLLNMELRYFGNSEVHFINLVKEPGELTAADQPIELELRHNKNGDREDVLFNAFVSFDLSAIMIEDQDSVSFIVRSVDYQGNESTFEGTYKYVIATE